MKTKQLLYTQQEMRVKQFGVLMVGIGGAMIFSGILTLFRVDATVLILLGICAFIAGEYGYRKVRKNPWMLAEPAPRTEE